MVALIAIAACLPVALVDISCASSVCALGGRGDRKRLISDGDRMYSRGAFHAAASIYQQAVKTDPEDWKARLRLGMSLARTGADKQAMAELFHSLVLNARNPEENIEARKMIAALLMKQGEFDEAGGQLKQVLEIEPEDLVTRGNLALCMDKLGFVDAAIEQLKIIAEKQPDSPVTLYNLGISLLKKNEFPLALACFKRVISLKPGHSMAYVGLARAMIGQKQTVSAIAACNRAISLSPNNNFAYLALGDAYEAAGNQGRALEAYKKAIQIDPKDPGSKAALAKLLDNSKRIAGTGDLTYK